MIYKWEDLCESQEFEHDQKFVKAEHWRDACDELDDKTKTIAHLNKELQELRQFKKDALKVIGFYGEARNWNDSQDCDYAHLDIDESDASVPDGYCDNRGGKRAREFLSKYSEKKEE